MNPLAEMVCVEEGHAPGCPCTAGGDVELERIRGCICDPYDIARGVHRPSCPSHPWTAQDEFDLHAAIKEQQFAGQFVISPLSMLRCSECGDLLDAYGCCTRHGLIDTEALDGYEH